MSWLVDFASAEACSAPPKTLPLPFTFLCPFLGNEHTAVGRPVAESRAKGQRATQRVAAAVAERPQTAHVAGAHSDTGQWLTCLLADTVTASCRAREQSTVSKIG